MRNKKKLLVLGIGQTNFLAPLYLAVKRYHPEILVHISKQKKLDGQVGWGENEAFDKVIAPKMAFNISTILGSIKILFTKHCVQLLVLALVTNGARKAIRLFLKLTKNYVLAKNEYSRYDFYHIHFVNLDNLLIVPFLPKGSKVILSFWGSDLMRNSRLLNHYMVSNALGRADITTIQSIELREMILVKYGRQYRTKIRINKFILDRRIFSAIDEIQKEGVVSKFINTNKINVLVGHNANIENNHIDIVVSLAKLPDAIRSNLNLIFVFSYGGKSVESTELYRKDLEKILRPTKLTFSFIEHFLNFYEMASLRAGTDVVLHFPTSDALSAAVTESMYAGSMVLTGGWLPYGTFRRAGIKFYELEKIEDLVRTFPMLLENIEKEKVGFKPNRDLVANYFLSDEVEIKWAQLYES